MHQPDKNQNQKKEREITIEDKFNFINSKIKDFFYIQKRGGAYSFDLKYPDKKLNITANNEAVRCSV